MIEKGDEENVQEEYIPYSQRISEAVEEHRKELFKKGNIGQRYPLSDSEKRFAKALINLYNNPDFKVFLELENFEAGERMVRSLDTPSESIFPSKDFGQQMAFNKGRHFQMGYLRKQRDQLVSIYLHNLKVEKRGEQNGED